MGDLKNKDVVTKDMLKEGKSIIMKEYPINKDGTPHQDLANILGLKNIDFAEFAMRLGLTTKQARASIKAVLNEREINSKPVVTNEMFEQGKAVIKKLFPNSDGTHNNDLVKMLDLDYNQLKEFSGKHGLTIEQAKVCIEGVLDDRKNGKVV